MTDGAQHDPRALAEQLKRALAEAIPILEQDRAVLGWESWRGDLQRLSTLSAPRTYLVHARAIHLAKGDPAELLPVVQAVLAKLEHDYP